MQTRVLWLDVAKGIAIVLVVFHHALLLLGANGIKYFPYWEINAVLKLIRMPLFFFCAGITASFAIHRLPLEYWHKRVLPLLWILSVWTAIYVCADHVIPMHRDRIPLEFSLLRPQMNFWFIWVLMILSFAAPLFARLNAFFVVAAFMAGLLLWKAGILSYSGEVFKSEHIEAVLEYAPLFALGIFLAPRIIAIADDQRQSMWLLLISCAAFSGMLVLAALIPALDWPLRNAARFVGVTVGVSVAVYMARVEVVRAFFTAIGARSLEIFLGHQLFLAFAAFVIATIPSLQNMTGLVSTLAVTGLGVIGALGLWKILVKARVYWIYQIPKPLAYVARPDVSAKVGTIGSVR